MNSSEQVLHIVTNALPKASADEKIDLVDQLMRCLAVAITSACGGKPQAIAKLLEGVSIQLVEEVASMGPQVAMIEELKRAARRKT